MHCMPTYLPTCSIGGVNGQIAGFYQTKTYVVETSYHCCSFEPVLHDCSLSVLMAFLNG